LGWKRNTEGNAPQTRATFVAFDMTSKDCNHFEVTFEPRHASLKKRQINGKSKTKSKKNKVRTGKTL